MQRMVVTGLLVACVGSASKDPSDTDAGDSDVAVDTDTGTDTDTDPPDTDVPVVPSCVLGTGLDVPTPLQPGGEATVVRGSQGGWHVFGAVSCTGIVAGGASGSTALADISNPDNPVIDWRIVDADGVLLAGYDGLHRPMETGGGAGLLGEFLVFWTTPYAEAVDRDATMTFHLVDKHAVTIDLSIPIRLVAEDGGVGDTDAPQ